MSGLALGSGLARGFANVLLSKRQKDQEDAVRKETQQHQLKLMAGMKLIDEGHDPNVVLPALGLDFTFGEKPQKGAPDPNEMLSGLLSAARPQVQPAAAGAQKADVGRDVQATAEGILPSSTAVSPATPAPQAKVGALGLPWTSPEQRFQQTLSQTTQLEEAKERVKAQAMRLQIQAFMAENPGATHEQAMTRLGFLKPVEDKFATIPVGGGVYNKETGDITESPSARVTNLPAQLRERVEELRGMNPDWPEEKLRLEASKLLTEEREADRAMKIANLESIRANRALQGTLLKMQEAQGGITPNNAAGLTTTLRKDWTKATEPMRSRETYIAKLNDTVTKDKNGKTMIQRDRNAATQTIINSFNRLLEEGNAVREGEYQRSESLSPLMTRLGAMITAAQVGGGTLTDPQLESLAREGLQIAAATKAVHEEGLRDLRSGITSQLQRYNLPEKDVFGLSKVGVPTFTATNAKGQVFTTDSQAKLDAWKRKYPDYK